ncbi:hypothetical protein B0I35DRAFT_423050, partial [Stachybotrys elegans]
MPVFVVLCLCVPSFKAVLSPMTTFAAHCRSQPSIHTTSLPIAQVRELPAYGLHLHRTAFPLVWLSAIWSGGKRTSPQITVAPTRRLGLANLLPVAARPYPLAP